MKEVEFSKCPYHLDKGIEQRNKVSSINDFWPNKLDLSILRQNDKKSNPLDFEFNYKNEFLKLDLKEVKKDINELMTKSVDWWPADYGHYGPLFIRMAWHSAGTYRVYDGRGGASSGNQRFAPLNSWPDNANLDKSRYLLWPIKQKYGTKISWADLMILAGNCALESMGVNTIGFAGGRVDVWEPELDVNWGKEVEWMASERYDNNNELEEPYAAVQMGLIYVNPEGPDGKPDIYLSGKHIRETFFRMGMNDEETVALIAGGHTFGKAHGAAETKFVGPEPEGASIQEMGFGWKNSFGCGKGVDTITSGIEGAWKPNPTKWDNGYLTILFKYDWELIKSPAGAIQWQPINVEVDDLIEDAHIPGKKHAPMMTTADLAIKFDPIFKDIAEKYLNDFDLFSSEFAKAWFKLTHRDLGPKTIYLGSEVPKETFIWQDPIPACSNDVITDADIEQLKEIISNTSLSISDLVATAWASASTFRNSDKRGGANGARIRFNQIMNWEVNNPKKVKKTIEQLEKIKLQFNKKISMADLIVLGGCTAIENAIKASGKMKKVPFSAWRSDAIIEETDFISYNFLKPKADGFRNYVSKICKHIPAETLLIDKAQLLSLSIPEMTVLFGGLRVLDINYNNLKFGVFTENPQILSNDFFKIVLNNDVIWEEIANNSGQYKGIDRYTWEVKYYATRTDLIFASNSELRAVTEVYAVNDSEEKFLNDFIKAWNKVMNLDKFN